MERAERLRAAVKGAGGNKATAERAGLLVGTLSRYLGGRDMKASALVSLAEACRVTLEWLATGRGPMRPGDAPAAPPPASASQPPPAEPRPRTLFGQIDADRLADAYAAAIQALAKRGHTNPEPRRVMQVTVLLYDSLTEAEETQ